MNNFPANDIQLKDANDIDDENEYFDKEYFKCVEKTQRNHERAQQQEVERAKEIAAEKRICHFHRLASPIK